jgi:hypothetical protein
MAPAVGYFSVHVCIEYALFCTWEILFLSAICPHENSVLA